ncbi:dimeric dUTPase (all-alpha-NTP-PPase superfamily) [Bacillus sp. SORGH_AS 510]|uniref:dUTP diphosphatase n=1 Tax=Bacillus sp. SORGH_AS_0510 TaxID=3041771 RepID=UPI002787A7D8|nr:dUTP diphosphatase [Bacillus sp. SORGH_AS_0510]MDQ1144801.1 dimeric dUTPase (all-alpha-NTP-PPase superfamily) [Bacillus sp. SORGH_AS_0510]
MNLEKLFHMQKALDSHIEEKHELQKENLFERKALALLVEIGELANETRCFKFWSVKPSSEKDVILEEFVDGIHFILSLGIECGFNKVPIELEGINSTSTVTEQFLAVYETISLFQKNKELDGYINVFESYMQLAALLGFTKEEIEEAYFRKNEVNYQRQQNNY